MGLGWGKEESDSDLALQEIRLKQHAPAVENACGRDCSKELHRVPKHHLYLKMAGKFLDTKTSLGVVWSTL